MDEERATTDPAQEANAGRLATFLLEQGLGGAGPLAGAEQLAAEYLADASYRSDDERIDALVRAETRKNFTTGFVTGLGGLATFAVSIPAALTASWVLQARLAGAIARIHGHDLSSERVRTKVLLSLAGDVAKEAMKDLGLKPDGSLTQRAVDQIPGRALVEVNKRIGARLLTSATQRFLLRFPRAVPILGGIVGGSLDAAVCRKVARTARTLFAPPAGAVIDGKAKPERASARSRRSARQAD
jgi:hypothetical protein